MTNDVAALLNYLTPRERAQLDRLLTPTQHAKAIWTPFPDPSPGRIHPQRLALESKADILLYGGQAGGGKTDLILGAASTQHYDSIVFRRESTQLRGILQRSHELFDDVGIFAGSPTPTWRLPGKRRIEFAGVKDLGDEKKHQGQPHDLVAFDELAHFLKAQFLYLIGWNRPSQRGRRCRVIAASNPPTDAEGEWIIGYWAPWLDPNHPNPAKPGELRWFTTIDGVDVECPNGEPFMHGGELVTPKSRTFIPASVRDNPVLAESGYIATLQALPEPLRSKMLFGSFTAGREDPPDQVIPSEWVELAMQRWRDRPRPSSPMSAIGVDVARGGNDKTVLTPRFDNWFDFPQATPGKQTPDGNAVLQLIIALRNGSRCRVKIDVIGVGASVYDIAKDDDVLGFAAIPMHAAMKTEARDRSGQLAFVNQRARWYWQFREALDPEHGEDLALPPDPELKSDLTAPKWKLRSNGIQVESKDDIIARIGRSPDKGDSCVYAHAEPDLDGAGLMDFYAAAAADLQRQRAGAQGA